MPLLFSESFDLTDTLAEIFDTVSGGVSISATAARNGAGGLLSTSVNGRVVKNITTSTTLFLGFALNVAVAGSSAEQICSFIDGATIQTDLRLDATGHLIFTRNGTTLATSTSSMTFGVWHYIEVKLVIDPTVGIAEAKVDGVFFLQLTGQNTRSTANSSAGAVQLSGQIGAGSWTRWFDDVYCNTTGYLGDIRVTALLPTANGTTNNFTAAAATWVANQVEQIGVQILDSNGNIQRVTAVTGNAKTGAGPAPTWSTTLNATTADNNVTWTLIAKTPLANWMYVDEPYPDDDSSYVFSSNIGDIDRYTYPAITASQVFAVVVKMRVDKDNAGTRTVRAAVKSGATVSDNGSDFPLTQNSYSTVEGIFETDPNTGIAWTQAGVNAAEFGVKLTA